MSLALYRKYRPATFAEVVGQEHVTEPLTQALRKGTLNHAYLFSGPRGCGKTSSARILARSLNCEKGPTPDPCGVCDSCVALAPGGPGSLDVIEIDAASHGRIDDARDLRERAFFAPVASRQKVYVVDEAHMVTKEGFNALLKLVEEPPEFVTFIFATTEPDKVLPTIRSRTHHYPFRLVPPGVLRGLLEDVCSREGVAVEPAVLPLVVRAGAGSVRDALSLLDQLVAGAGPEGVTYARAMALLGVTDAALLDEVVDALGAADGAAVFGAVDRVVEAGHDPRRFATDLLERLRDLIVLDAVPDAVDKGLVDQPSDQLARMSEQAGRLGGAALSRAADIVHEGLVEMRGTTMPRLLLELVCARMLLPAASVDPAAFLQRLERLERRLAIGGVPAAAEPAAPAVAPATRTPEPPPTTAPAPEARRDLAAPPVRGEPTAPARGRSDPPAPAAEPPARPPDRPPAAGPLSGGLYAAAVRRSWPEVLDAVKKRRRTTQVLLASATVSAVEGATLVLALSAAPLARRMAEEANLEVLREALREVLGVDWKVRCVAATDPATPVAPAAPAADEPTADEIAAAVEPATGADDRGRSAEDEAMSLLASGLGARRIVERDGG